jgi:hypothetical protein
MRKLLPVEGHPHLVRDMKTGVICNINKSKAEQAGRVRLQRMKERAEVEDLKSEVHELKTMLQKLLENGQNA